MGTQELGTPVLSGLFLTPEGFGQDDGGQLDDFHLLSFALRNERMTDDLLEYKHELIERVHTAIQKQEELIGECAKDHRQEVPRTVYTLSMLRLRYLLKAYWKARLAKIERFATAILDNEALRSKCSEREVRYCLDCFVAVGRCLKEVVLDTLPPEFQTLVQESQLSDSKDMIPQPKLDSYVFVKLLQDAGHVALDEGGQQLVDMKAGDLYIVQYKQVQHLIHNDVAVLV